MARKNSNAGQPNRIAQSKRHATRVTVAKQHHRKEHHRSSLAVLGPLSEHLIHTEKAEGELVETTRFLVEAAA